MKYRVFGNTGIKVSILGFGAMRLPEEKTGQKYRVREDIAIDMIHEAFNSGINYIDTAYPYCHGQSELVVGKALKGWRNKIYLSTKMPTWKVNRSDDYKIFLEEQLKKLDVDYIDFYHFHALDEDSFKNKVLKFNLLDKAASSVEQGLIKFISFSFHDKPQVMKKIIDTGYFSSVLCQYNLLDRSNEEMMAYAKDKGLGVAVMGPIGGGRVTALDFLKDKTGGKIFSLAEIALKFVFSNSNVSTALSGMENMQMVKENIKTAGGLYNLTANERRIIQKFLNEEKVKRLIKCNNCRYCLPCPSEVAIPDLFKIANYYTLTGLSQNSKYEYLKIRSSGSGELADACTECGECEKKCPQGLKIIEELKKVYKMLE